MIYLIVLVILLFFTVIFDFGTEKYGKEIAYYGILIGLICFSGFRYKVGGDTYMYMEEFPNLPNISGLANYETGINKRQPLWVFLVAISKSISQEFYMLQFFHAIIVNTLIFKFIKVNTQYVFTGILLYYIGYYCYFNFEILRESISISIFLFSMRYLIDKKWFVYFSLSIIAFLFHFSAVILFLFPLLINLKFSFLRALLLFVFGVFFSSYFSAFVDSVNLVGGFITSMKGYVEYSPSLWGIIAIVVTYILYPTIVYKLCNSFLKIDSELYGLLYIYILIGAATGFFYIFFRFLNYLTPILFIFLTEILHGFFRRKDLRPIRMFVATTVFLLFSVIYMSTYFTDTSKLVYGSRWYSRWYPYYSIFDKKEDETRENLIRAQNEDYFN